MFKIRWSKEDCQRLRKQTSSCQGEGQREGMVREFGMDRYSLLYLKWITNNDLLYSTWNSPHCYVAAWMGGEYRGELLLFSRYCVWLFMTPWTVAPQSPPSMGFPSKNTGVGCNFLYQGIFPTQRLNLVSCTGMWIFYHWAISGKWIHVYVWLSSFAAHLKLPQHC